MKSVKVKMNAGTSPNTYLLQRHVHTDACVFCLNTGKNTQLFYENCCILKGMWKNSSDYIILSRTKSTEEEDLKASQCLSVPFRGQLEGGVRTPLEDCMMN